MISQGELLNLLEYDPETGLWRWRNPYEGRNRKKGWFSGALARNGYMQIRVMGVTYYAHRLAWLYVHGFWEEFMDHKNRDRSDNRLENLRPADKSKNAVNAQTRSDNSSGHPGVSLHKQTGKWHAYINKEGKRINRFFSFREDAISWYKRMRENLYGEFVPEDDKVVLLDLKQSA